MTAPLPHYLLFSEATLDSPLGGTWRFALEQVGNPEVLSASDFEAAECTERLELLAVVRGLEALDQPARVTLVTKSRYVSRGLRRGINDWRSNGWKWERFGRTVMVRDHDLWRRVDRALQFHQVDCRLWQFDAVTNDQPEPALAPAPQRQPVRKVAAWRKAAAVLGDAFRPAGLAAG